MLNRILYNSNNVKRSTLLIVGQAAQPTGFARQTRCIANGLASKYDVHVLGIDEYEDHTLPQMTPAGSRWTIHGNPDKNLIFAETQAAKLVEQLRPELVLLFNDPWFIPRYFGPLQAADHKCQVVAYFPIDGRILRPEIITALNSSDHLVVYTQFARDVVIECAGEQGLGDSEPFVSTDIVPHGVESGDFFPWPSADMDLSTRRLAARQILFPNQPELWEGFWVLNANRNQMRKRIDLTLRGFARFAANKPPNVRLYLHMGMKEVGINIRAMAYQLGIEDRLLFTGSSDTHPRCSTSKLNLIYNACDVGVNTATGEGWGLVSCEHAATGAPQIVPRHSACAEIWKGSAHLLDPIAHDRTTGLLEGAVIAPADLASALDLLYDVPTHYRRLADAGIRCATKQEYRWDAIALRWDDIFQNLIKSKKIFPTPACSLNKGGEYDTNN